MTKSRGIRKKPNASHADRFRFLKEAMRYEGDACLFWPFGRSSNGYGLITLDSRVQGAHVVICEWAYGPRPSVEHECAHSCGQGHLGCIAKRHLRWATGAENGADKIKHGRSLTGIKHPMVKLSEDQVRAIRGDARSPTIIARDYNISRGAVWFIRTRGTWKHLDN